MTSDGKVTATEAKMIAVGFQPAFAKLCVTAAGACMDIGKGKPEIEQAVAEAIPGLMALAKCVVEADRSKLVNWQERSNKLRNCGDLARILLSRLGIEERKG